MNTIRFFTVAALFYQKLGCAAEDLLTAAGDGGLACFVEANGLRGSWDGPAEPPAPPPTHLALTARSCREIATYGSANVDAFEACDGAELRRFRPAEIQWIDRQQLRFAHPLTPGREPPHP